MHYGWAPVMGSHSLTAPPGRISTANERTSDWECLPGTGLDTVASQLWDEDPALNQLAIVNRWPNVTG